MTWSFGSDPAAQLEDSSPSPFSTLTAATASTEPRPSKSLKINRDLLLYKARLETSAAEHSPSKAQKLAREAVAEASLRRCLAMDATDGRPYVALGKMFVGQRRFDEARKLYENGSMATDGGNAYIWQAWATLEAKTGNIKYARQLFDAAVTADKTHAASWHGWGLLEKRQGNLLRARDIWLKGIKQTVKRPNPFLYQSVAVLAGEMGLTKESRQWFKDATHLFKGAGRHGIWQAWAQMEARQGKREDVRWLLKKGLEAAPRSRYLHLTSALWEKELGARASARHLLRRGHECNRSDPALLQAWAIMEEEDGNLDAARGLFEKATVADPHHTPVWQAWGCLEQRQGKLDRARKLFQSGVWADPGSSKVTSVWQAWAMLEAQAGNVSLTRQLFKCAVKADPSSAPSWLGWAAFELQMGNTERSQELVDLHRQSNLQIVWPRGFAAGFAPPSETPDGAWQSMSKWFSQFGAGSRNRPGPEIAAKKRAATSAPEPLKALSSYEEPEVEDVDAVMAKLQRVTPPNLELSVLASDEFDAEWDLEVEAVA
ncbi:hypothetical protein WJX73_006036 [Symbiochloris irregularis]|uniref:Pre-mRNA-splicing factor Syf1/CRNKL1-like C-terminal HAT-repeats domain-containing protein n=1 Tax=Symbiochloris irregularis TaxID=706552 RepID=A0AAW1NFJ4_9CHLO